MCSTSFPLFFSLSQLSLTSSATVEYTFDPVFVLPAAHATNDPDGQHTTQKIPHILLPRGLLASLDVLGQPLDAYLLIEARVGGDGGYTIPGLQYQEINIPATYSVSLFGETLGGELETRRELLDEQHP